MDSLQNEAIFERLSREVIEPGLCTHCGTCVGLSQSGLTMRETARGPLPAITGLPVKLPQAAFDACPGKGLNYPDLCQRVFGHLPDNWLLGCYRQVYIGYSQQPEIRRRGASAGVITHTLVYLLEQGLIDGVVVVQQGRPQPWQAEAIIAQTPAAIIAASQSVYAPIPVNTILAQIDRFEGRLAYVGLPDQVASLRRLQQLGHPAAQKIDYVLGPYVGTNMYFGAIESYLRTNGVHDVAQMAELRYREGEWPGCLQIKLKSGQILKAEKFYYNYLIPFFITRSTLFSVDFTNELTDISVGDAWSPRYEAQRQGFSVIVARSEKGEAVLQTMQAQGVVYLDPVPVDEALAMHGHMLDFKKRGAFIRMDWQAALGKAVPDYGYRPAAIPLSRKLVELVIALIFGVCGTRLARRTVEFIPLGLIGPLFNLLRQTWKNASKPTKRKGLQEVAFRLNPNNQTPREASMLTTLWQRTTTEVQHWLRPHWSLADVGRHWDSTEDYDDINEETYSYFRRFIDGLRLSDIPSGSRILDLCARTGNGTLYFYEHGRVGSAVCADVSPKMGEICQKRLREGGFHNFVWVHIFDYPLPFATNEFDHILCFETVEHVSRPERLVAELGRVVKPGGTMILTTPNVLWEPVHALATITGLHHSEGPHRFITQPRLRAIVEQAGFAIEKEETTVLVPGGPDWLVKAGEWLEEKTRHSLMPWLGLRRILICRKR